MTLGAYERNETRLARLVANSNRILDAMADDVTRGIDAEARRRVTEIPLGLETVARPPDVPLGLEGLPRRDLGPYANLQDVVLGAPPPQPTFEEPSGPSIFERGISAAGDFLEPALGPVGALMQPPSTTIREVLETGTRPFGTMQAAPSPETQAAIRGTQAAFEATDIPGPFESMIPESNLDEIERIFGPNVRRELEFLFSPAGAATAIMFPAGTLGGAAGGIGAGEAVRQAGGSEEAQIAAQVVGNVIGGGAAEAFAARGPSVVSRVAQAVPEPRPPQADPVPPRGPLASEAVEPPFVPRGRRPSETFRAEPSVIEGTLPTRDVAAMELRRTLQIAAPKLEARASINQEIARLEAQLAAGGKVVKGQGRQAAIQRRIRQYRDIIENPHVAKGDPHPPPPPSDPPADLPPVRGETPDDLEPLRLTGEMPEETLIRRHQGAIDTAALEAERDVETGNRLLKQSGLGQGFRGTIVEKTPGELDELNRALHNPSKVASGEMTVPENLRPVYNQLRQVTDWEQAARIDFDPDMALVEDYFFRGWKPPEGMFTGEARGPLGRNPAFRMPRVDASYDEMRAAGFEPLFANPVEQARYSRLMGVKYREQMTLIEDLKVREIAVPDAGGPMPEGYRVPKVGSAFEGKPYATGDGGTAFTRRWAVQDSLANRLENAYGKTPNMGKGTIFGKTVDFQKAVDVAVFIPKRAKLVGSVFQHVDFLTRSGIGAWTGALDALRRGQGIAAAGNLARWPKSVYTMVRAVTGPGWRQNLRNMALDTTPLFKNRKLSMKMISEAGLSRRDPTIGIDIDDIAREIRQEHKITKGLKAPFRALGELERMWRDGLFKGMYHAAILTDVKNNIAPMIARQHPDATDAQLAGMIAKAANVNYSVVPASMSVVQNRVMRSILTRMFFSLGEQEGLLRFFTGAIKGENAAYFRTRWLGAYVALVGMANIIHFASTGEPLPKDRFQPLSRGGWGPLPLGYNRDFAAPDIPLTGRSGTEVSLDLVGQMDTAFRLLDPESYLKSRESVPIRALENQRTGTDFYGAPIDTVGPGGVFSRTAQLTNDMFAPIGPGQAGAEILRSNVEEVEGLIQPGEARLGTAGLGLQATGINLRAETTPQLLDRIRGDVMREMEIEQSYEQIAAENDPLQTQIDNEVERRIGPELEKRRETSALRGQVTPESKFFGQVEESRAAQEQEQLAADAKLNSKQWQGDVWREDFRNRTKTSFDEREGMRQAHEIDYTDRKGKAPPESVNAAIENYFSINIEDPAYTRRDGTVDWEAFFNAQDAALKPLSASNEKAVREWLRKFDTPTVTQFRKAQGVVDKFYDTPKYEGLSLEDGEEADRILNDVITQIQLQALRQGIQLERADAIRHAIRNGQVRDEDVANWLRRRFRRRRRSSSSRRSRRRAEDVQSPERDLILFENQSLLGKFYPDLLRRQLSREQEASLGGEAFAAVSR